VTDEIHSNLNTIHDVVVVGAGFSGICAGVKLQENGITNFVILEKNSGVGGTWWKNNYPGSQCDVPSQLYCFSFEMNPNWSRRFAPQTEIQQYLQGVVDKYGLGKHLFNGVEALRYILDDKTKLWHTHLADGTILRSHHVICGTGGLCIPSYPNIPGRDSFGGTSMHSMHWDPEFDYANKRIGIIGSAASAIQILPPVSETAKHVTLFQRSANYIAPRVDPVYSDKEKARRRRFPWLMKAERAFYWTFLETIFYSVTRKHSFLRKGLSKLMLNQITDTIKDPALRKKLTPNHQLGCKRPLMSNNFYAALNRDNTLLETTTIEAIEPTGVLTSDGHLHEFDAIVYATGFDMGKAWDLDVTGTQGRSLKKQWAEGASAYQGNSIPNAPNFYLSTGPNVALGNMSFVYIIEAQIEYILKCIKASGSTHLLEVKEDVNQAYNDVIQKALIDETIWFDGCSNWFVNEAGKCTVNYPWRSYTMRRKLQKFDIENYTLTEA